MPRPLPIRTTILIVGAGPVGISLAIALSEQGVNDFIIVDKLEHTPNTIRAFSIHAATMEALDTIGVADTLATRCTAAHCTHLCSRSGATLFTIDFYDALQECSKFPYSYIVPQNITEEVLTRKLNELGVKIWRGEKYRVVGMKGVTGSEDSATVEFEGGEMVEAKYIIGADGAKSVIRQISGISFNDPRPSKSSSQMIVADVYFAQPPPSLLPPRYKNEMCLTPSATGFMLFEPFPSEGSDPKGPLIRIATAIPPEMGTPPDHPDLEYWQAAWDKFGPYKKSKIEEVVTSARFRTHSAVVDR